MIVIARTLRVRCKPTPLPIILILKMSMNIPPYFAVETPVAIARFCDDDNCRDAIA